MRQHTAMSLDAFSYELFHPRTSFSVTPLGIYTRRSRMIEIRAQWTNRKCADAWRYRPRISTVPVEDSLTDQEMPANGVLLQLDSAATAIAVLDRPHGATTMPIPTKQQIHIAHLEVAAALHLRDETMIASH